MGEVKKAYADYGYYYQRFAKTFRDIENIIEEEGGVEIKPFGKDNYFRANGFEHKFYNLEDRGTVYLRSWGDWKMSEGRRVSSIYAEVHDSDGELYSKIKDVLLNSKERLMKHERVGLEEKFD